MSCHCHTQCNRIGQCCALAPYRCADNDTGYNTRIVLNARSYIKAMPSTTCSAHAPNACSANKAMPSTARSAHAPNACSANKAMPSTTRSAHAPNACSANKAIPIATCFAHAPMQGYNKRISL